MIKLGKYISELLHNNDYVTVPGFGTFSTKYIPARFIPEEKIVESPRKIVDFRPEPKQGETPIIDYISKKEGKSHEEVLQQLTDTLRETEHSLEAGNKVELDLIGTFHRDTDGSLNFEASHQVNYLKNDTGISSVKTPPQKPLQEVKAVEPEPTPETIKTKEKISKTQTLETMKEPEKKGPTPKPGKPEKERMDPVLKWLAIIGIPLLIILIVLFWQFNYFFGEGGLFSRSETVGIETTAPAPATAEIIQEVEETPEPEPEPDIEPTHAEPPFDPYLEPAKPQPNRPVYYIVVGSFRSEHNATSMALDLRKKDHRLSSVLTKTPTGFYRTYSGWYYDLDEAKAKKQQLDEDLRHIAWILHR